MNLKIKRSGSRASLHKLNRINNLRQLILTLLLEKINSVVHITRVRTAAHSTISLVKYKALRLQIIKEQFRQCTGRWDRHFVIYPISGYEDICLMM